MTTTIQTPVDRSPAVKALETMLLIRAFEENSAALQAAGKAPVMCTSAGQEAAAVGVVSALGPQDRILTNHRSAGHLLARGADPGRILAEIMGKATGYNGGRSGSLHVSSRELGVVLTSTIVGGELSLATGVALALQQEKKGALAAVFFGDGAATEGIFHESVNLASVWDLPVLFACENNQWRAYVHRTETMRTDHISEWARGYGIAARTVDGNDLDAVAAAAREAVSYIRETGRPYFLESYTYRLRGHMEPDDQAYVNKDELASWKRRDPIHALEARLLAGGMLSKEALQEIKERVRLVIEEATEFALNSPYPAMETMATDVYA